MTTPVPFVIFGASDDLIEVEGPTSEEYPTDNGVVRLTAPDGMTLDVVVVFGRGGWAVSVRVTTDQPIPDWPIRFVPAPGSKEPDPAAEITAPAGTTFELLATP